jgi:predicted AlkP superfamily pyrophosphatase or phosphodiesterase
MIKRRLTRLLRLFFAVLALFLGLGLQLQAADRVFVFSFDGLGHQILTKLPAAAQLKTLRAWAARGAIADGIVPAFPSTTANSHAALWTGAYGDVSLITANNQPVVPRAEHTFLERSNGYRSDQLAAEPLWVAAARQGKKVVAYQVTQAIPFRDINTHPNAVVINSYQTREVARHQLLRRSDFVIGDGGRFTFRHGELTLAGEFLQEGLRIEGVTVKPAPVSQGLSEGPLARHFSDPLWIEQPFPAAIYFRLFRYSKDDLLLYVSPVEETAFSIGEAREMLREAGGTVNNSMLFSDVELGIGLETMELAARQNARQTAWLWRKHKPDLFIGYNPFADEVEHQYLGAYLRGDTEAKRAMDWAFAIVERWSREIGALMEERDHVVITSDHGMSPTYQSVNVNEILRRAGLADEASLVYNSILLNTTDWKGGAVRDREALRKRVRAALESVRNGGPVFTAFFTADGGRFALNGPAGSDLYFDLAPGYTVQDVAGQLFPQPARMGGNHGFRPDREDMLAVLIAAGPRIAPGTKWPRLKSIDFTSLVSDLLGVDPPRQAQGRSPLAK